MGSASTAARVYFVSLVDGDFEWKGEYVADNDAMARFMFMREWLGMIVSHDVRPSELKVERASKQYEQRYSVRV